MHKLIRASIAATVLAAAPAYAGGGHGHGHGHWKGQGPHWKHDKHVHHHYGPPRHVVQHVHRYHPPRVVHHYYAPPYYAPSYYTPSYYAPAAGIHVVLPSVYIPFN